MVFSFIYLFLFKFCKKEAGQGWGKEFSSWGPVKSPSNFKTIRYSYPCGCIWCSHRYKTMTTPFSFLTIWCMHLHTIVSLPFTLIHTDRYCDICGVAEVEVEAPTHWALILSFETTPSSGFSHVEFHMYSLYIASGFFGVLLLRRNTLLSVLE